MVSADHLLAFTAMSFLLIVIPGPCVLFMVGRALAHGRRGALTTVAGNTLGACVLVVAFGVGTVVERSVLIFTALQLAGAAYLVFLGVKAWRERKSLHAAVTGIGGAQGGLRTFREGFAVGVTNPKTIVFFAAVSPQFVDRGQGQVAVQMLLLGLVFGIIAVASDMVWGLLAATARDWFVRSPHRLSVVGGIGGLTMIGLGVTVAATVFNQRSSKPLTTRRDWPGQLRFRVATTAVATPTAVSTAMPRAIQRAESTIESSPIRISVPAIAALTA